MKNKKGFTLAEILGIIIIIGILLVIVAPAITSRINNLKDKSKDTGYELVYMAVSQHITENKLKYPSGKKYCIKISDIIDEGKLTSPVKEIDTGKTIDDYSVLVSIYSSGNEYYELIANADECQAEANLPLIDFIVNPGVNVWTNGNKTVTIIYPDGSTLNKHKKDDLPWAASAGNRPNIVFEENGKLTAKAEYNGTTISSKINIEKIDKNKPFMNFSPDEQAAYVKGGKKVKITITDNESGLLGNQTLSYAWTNSTSTPTSGWKTIKTTNVNGAKSTKVTIPVEDSSALSGTYYLHVKSGIKDMAGNNSAASKSNKFMFDNTKPSISFSPNTQTTYVGGGKEITITIEDSGSGLKKTQTVSYAWTNSTSTPINGWKTIKTTNSDGAKSTTVKVPASASKGLEGIYYLHVKSGITDMVGNESDEARTNKFIFDSKGPECTNSGDSTSWTKNNRTITWGCSDDASGCKEGKSGGSTTYDTTTKTATIPAYTIEDNAGNTTTCPKRTANVYVDKTAPTFSRIVNSSNGNWTKNNVRIDLEGNDSESGIARWEHSEIDIPRIELVGHVQTFGTTIANDNGWVGSTGLGKRLEAFSMRLVNNPHANSGVTYSAQVQNDINYEGGNWQGEKSNGVLAGTINQSKKIYSVNARLTGDISNYYNIQYQTHNQTDGNTPFAVNGANTYNSGNRRVEALYAMLTQKAEPGPRTYSSYSNSNSTTYSTTVSAQQDKRYYFRACDNVGNCSEYRATNVKIDKTNPTLSDIKEIGSNIAALCYDTGGSGVQIVSSSSSTSNTLTCNDHAGNSASKTQPIALSLIQGEPSIAVCPCDANMPSRDECFQYAGNNYNTMYISNMSVSGTTFKFHVRIKSNSMSAGWSHNCSDGTKGKLCFAKGDNGTSCYKEIKTGISVSGFCSIGADIVNEDFSVDMSSYDSGSYRIIFIGASDWNVSSFYQNSAASSGNYAVVKKG